jgi:hypothetical protein
MGGYNMEKIRKKWSSMDLFGKCSYLSVGLLFFLIPFTGLVLESLNISIIKFEIILGIYVLSIICSILAKKWKLIIIATGCHLKGPIALRHNVSITF